MYADLNDLAKADGAVKAIAADCQKLVEQELATKSGVSPVPVAPTGAVSVTFGDALYHSGADDNFNVKMPGSFISRRFSTSTSRHYDNLGFSSGVAAPAWDEARNPCSTIMTMADFDPAR